MAAAARPNPLAARKSPIATMVDCAVAVPQTSLAASKRPSAAQSKVPSAQSSARLSWLASGGSPNRRATRSRIGGCHAPGPTHMSRTAAQRINHCGTSAGPIRSLSISRGARASRSPAASASTTISASTRRASRSRSRSSIARVPGMRSASSGKAASSHCENAWIVSIRKPPPGQSSTLAKSVRARSRVAGSFDAPISVSSLPSRVSSSRTQRASTALTRSAISAAPALVKVRHRICPGATPGRSNSRRTRADRTCVLPVPADADSQTLRSGATACAWLSASGTTFPLIPGHSFANILQPHPLI